MTKILDTFLIIAIHAVFLSQLTLLDSIALIEFCKEN
jgi:hypothetical protein